MKFISHTYDDGSFAFIRQVSFEWAVTGVEIGNRESIFEYHLPEMIKLAKEKFGTYRPIQVEYPELEQNFDVMVFVDITRKCYNENSYISDVGVIFFCSQDDLNLESIFIKALSIINWSITRRYDPGEY